MIIIKDYKIKHYDINPFNKEKKLLEINTDILKDRNSQICVIIENADSASEIQSLSSRGNIDKEINQFLEHKLHDVKITNKNLFYKYERTHNIQYLEKIINQPRNSLIKIILLPQLH